jgi:hypothetical protein
MLFEAGVVSLGCFCALECSEDPNCSCRAFDSNNTRKLDFGEFQRLHYFLVNVQNSFSTFDQDRSGTLAPNEIMNALRQAGGWGNDTGCLLELLNSTRMLRRATPVL